MADVFENMGKITITQNRTVGSSDGGELSYIIHTQLSDPTDFSAILSAKSPDKLFLYQDGTYVRLVTLDDLTLYPASYPTEEGGYYRLGEATKTFSSDVDAASYANALYEAITKLLLVMHDYEVTLTSFTETDTVPNQNRSTLYNTIQSYVSVQSQLDDVEIQILTKQAAIDAFTEVVNLSELTSVVAEPDKAPEKLRDINLNLTVIKTRLDAINTAPTYSLKTTSDYFTAYSVPDVATSRKAAAESAILNVYAQIDIINTNWNGGGGVVKTLVNGTYPTQEGNITSALAQLYNLKTGLDDSMTSLGSAVTTIKSDLNTYIPSVKTASLTVTQATDTVSADQTLVNNNIATIDKGLRIKAINQSKLQDLYTQYTADMETLKAQKDSLLATKQKYAATLVSLEPSIDLNDPMTIYTHRIFKRPPS